MPDPLTCSHGAVLCAVHSQVVPLNVDRPQGGGYGEMRGFATCR
jgi:hypothetical protein